MAKPSVKVAFDEHGNVTLQVRKELYDFIVSAAAVDDDNEYIHFEESVTFDDAQAIFGTDDPPCRIVYGGVNLDDEP